MGFLVLCCAFGVEGDGPELYSNLLTMESSSIRPPRGFAFVEDKLCRAFFPLRGTQCFSFIDSINVGTIVNVSGQQFDAAFTSFLVSSNIRLVML